MKIRVGVSLVLAAWAMPASAEWQKVESDHFVIYADDREADVRRFAEMLERYHAAMQFAIGYKYAKPSPSNRVTVYSVGSARHVQDLVGGNSKYLQGFYIPRAAGSVAFVPDMRSTRGEPDEAFSTLLHECSHHFLISSQRAGMPRWVSEGAAEFYASATFQKDGSVNLGKPNVSRGYELFNADSLSIEELLDEERYSKRNSKRYDSFYGQAWLLYHYLTFSTARKGQLGAYLRAFGGGAAPLDAARTAFGDLKVLSDEMKQYLTARRMKMFTVKGELTAPGPITVARLTEGHTRMMPAIVRSRRGVDDEQAKAVVADARAIAAAYPADADVQAALAEAEYDAGNDAEAIAAADRAIAANPRTPDAYVQKGYTLFRLAADADDREAAYAAAMEPFARLNAFEPDHPLPLIYQYRSEQMMGVTPSLEAKKALLRASRVAPFDLGLTFQTGVMLAGDGKLELARSYLQTVAASPHGGTLAQTAHAAVAHLADRPEGERVRLAEVLVPDVPEVVEEPAS